MRHISEGGGQRTPWPKGDDTDIVAHTLEGARHQNRLAFGPAAAQVILEQQNFHLRNWETDGQ